MSLPLSTTAPLVTGSRALTCCCPARRRTELSPADWQQHWGLEVYVQWQGQQPCPPVPGPLLVLNRGSVPFTAPAAAVYVDAWTAPPPQIAGIFALHVLDRVDSPMRFLRQAAAALPPGGFLACTFAAWDAEGDDCAVGHDVRKRIYSAKTWRELAWFELPKAGLTLLGTPDWTYRGHACGDHTLATVVAVRTAGDPSVKETRR